MVGHRFSDHCCSSLTSIAGTNNSSALRNGVPGQGLLLFTSDGFFTRAASMPETHIEKDWLPVWLPCLRAYGDTRSVSQKITMAGLDSEGLASIVFSEPFAVDLSFRSN